LLPFGAAKGQEKGNANLWHNPKNRASHRQLAGDVSGRIAPAHVALPMRRMPNRPGDPPDESKLAVGGLLRRDRVHPFDGEDGMQLNTASRPADLYVTKVEEAGP
jgi:hypothetical protein